MINRFLAKFRKPARTTAIEIKPPEFVQIDASAAGVPKAAIVVGIGIVLCGSGLLLQPKTSPTLSMAAAPTDGVIAIPPEAPAKIQVAPAIAAEPMRPLSLTDIQSAGISTIKSSPSNYHTGKRGGCYTVTKNGNKRYVDRSKCR